MKTRTGGLTRQLREPKTLIWGFILTQLLRLTLGAFPQTACCNLAPKAFWCVGALLLMIGCAPHNAPVPGQTNVDRRWPPPRNPPVMVFTNIAAPPSPMRAVSQSMKMFVAIPQTNSPWTSNMLWVIHTRCGLDPQDHSRTNLIAVLTACDPEFYYRGMARGPILFKVLGLDTNSFQRGYLNVPVIIRHSTDHGQTWSFYTVTTNGMFLADPTNASDWFEALWSMDNFKTVK